MARTVRRLLSLLRLPRRRRKPTLDDAYQDGYAAGAGWGRMVGSGERDGTSWTRMNAYAAGYRDALDGLRFGMNRKVRP